MRQFFQELSQQRKILDGEKKRREALRYLPPAPGEPVASQPDDPDVAKMRKHERWKAALDLLVECTRLDPTSTWGLFALGRAYDFRLSVGEAMSAWTRFLALHDPGGKKDDATTRGVREYLDYHRNFGR